MGSLHLNFPVLRKNKIHINLTFNFCTILNFVIAESGFACHINHHSFLNCDFP